MNPFTPAATTARVASVVMAVIAVGLIGLFIDTLAGRSADSSKPPLEAGTPAESDRAGWAASTASSMASTRRGTDRFVEPGRRRG
jgi:hypothetical protein